MTLAQAPFTALIGRDSLARITPAETAIGPPITTARRLVEVSVSPTGAAAGAAVGVGSRPGAHPAGLPRRAPRRDARPPGRRDRRAAVYGRDAAVGSRRPWWADVADAGDGILVTVRRSKTNQDGETNDVRYLKNGAARSRYPGGSRPRGAARAADNRATVFGRGR